MSTSELAHGGGDLVEVEVAGAIHGNDGLPSPNDPVVDAPCCRRLTPDARAGGIDPSSSGTRGNRAAPLAASVPGSAPPGVRPALLYLREKARWRAWSFRP